MTMWKENLLGFADGKCAVINFFGMAM